MTGQISLKWHTVHILFSTSAYFIETGGIERVQAITEAEVEHSSPRKVSSSNSGAFSFSGKSSFSHAVAIETVRKCFFQRVAVLSYPGLKKRWLQNGVKH